MQDIAHHGRGIGRFGVGIGTGLVWWDQEVLLPVFGQVNWYPFIRREPWIGVHLARLGVIMRYGALFGAWKETDRGQLAGHTLTDVTMRYPFWSKGRSMAWLDLGFGMMIMRGRYEVEEEGELVERRRAEFLYPQLGVGMAF